MHNIFVDDFEGWRQNARVLLAQEIEPHKINWLLKNQDCLFEDLQNPQIIIKDKKFSVPKDFIDLAKTVACFRGDQKWALLYKTLWRLTHGEKNLMKITTDNDVLKLYHMEKAVRRDNHKMKAFVRFRKVENEEYFIAWHQPMHLILKRVVPFFVRRFSAMKFAIITPDASCFYDMENLYFGEGMPRQLAPQIKDDTEELWKTFYRNIFNPARIKVKMMKSEMPVKYWHTMPETTIIREMLEEAPKRVKKMIELQNTYNQKIL